MNTIKYLSGASEAVCQTEKETIERDIAEFCKNATDGQQCVDNGINNFPVYILKNSELKLFQYIDALHDNHKLSNKILAKLHICKYIDFKNNVSFTDDGGKNETKLPNIEFLLKKLEHGRHSTIIIDNDDRSLLAEIMQQLIYIDYPVSEINVSLRKEFKDAEKTRVFMREIDLLDKTSKEALKSIREIQLPDEAEDDGSYREISCRENQENAIKDFTENPSKISCRKIQEYAIKAFTEITQSIDKARDVEMKIAVAASKKTGKSVIVNSMLGMEIAPTSLELATPNVCTYKKSKDTNYHLKYDGKEKSFNDCGKIFESIQEEFKRAQDKKGGYDIPDMEISYVSQDNNFDSYTISDTPGPDAKGTNHKKSADKAMNECDVTIFAIDYSKYLTDTEVGYLKSIKKIFEDKNKFHSLIFVINKMDLALSDKGTKSRVKSIDFIRNRLMEIDEDQKFKDCIVFATSAQDYYYACDIRNKARHIKELEKLLDPETNWYDEIRIISDAISDNCDEDLEMTLSNIEGEVTKIKRQLGYDNVNIDCFENYSGMPQLLKHVKYVIQSKAREEIVNHVEWTIDQNYSTVKTIFDVIDNLKEFKAMNSEKIKRITSILDNYVQAIKSILTTDIQKEDYDNIKKPHEHFASVLEKILKTHEDNNFPIKQDELIHNLRAEITELNDIESLNRFWEEYYLRKQIKKIQKYQKDKVSIPRKNIPLSQNEIDSAVNDYISDSIKKQLISNKRVLDDAVDNLKRILENRILRVHDITEQCKEELRKNQCGQLVLPKLPNFNIDFARDYSKMPISLNNIECQINIPFDITDKRALIKFCEIFSSTAKEKDEVYIPAHLTEDDILQSLNSTYRSFSEWFSNANVNGALKESCSKLMEEVEDLNRNIFFTFRDINSRFQDTVNIFKSVLDDRATFKDEIDKINTKETFIQMIQQASDDFMDNWKTVVNP